jgi:hypothetical protein
MLGKWVVAGATEAAGLLVHHLLSSQSSLLTPEQMAALDSSLSQQLALIRTLKLCLPYQQHLQAAYAHAHHRRIAVLDGWFCTSDHSFQSLPYKAEHIVTAPVLNFTHQQLLAAKADVPALLQLLQSWYPDTAELAWVLRYLARCLAPCDTTKVVVLHVDTIDGQMGNRGKSSLLKLLQEALGVHAWPIRQGDMLTVGKSHTWASGGSQLHQPVLSCFDELSRPGGNHARTIDWSLVKFLTSGQVAAPGLWIAANPSDLFNLAALQQQDPTAYNRIVAVPARTAFQGQGSFIIIKTMERLAPALGFLLIQEHCEYTQHGMHEVPISMQAHKHLLTAFTNRPGFC